MNARSLTSLISAFLFATPAVAAADEDSNEIDEVVSFASQSDMQTASFDIGAIDVSAAEVSIDVAAIRVSAPVTPAVVAPAAAKTAEEAEEAE